MWLLALVVIVFVIGLYWWQDSLVTPIPKAVVNRFQRVRRGSTFLTLWRAVLSIALLALAVTLVSAGVLGGIVAFILVSMLVSEFVRDVVADLWDANFYEVS